MVSDLSSNRDLVVVIVGHCGEKMAGMQPLRVFFVGC